MNKVLAYFKNKSDFAFSQEIMVYGYEFNYPYLLVSSVLPYLFDDLKITENIAPENNNNRDGRVRFKKYIVIHDTGDTTKERNAAFWSNVVKTQQYKNKCYDASFQYVVGNDGIYHNIPDDEVAYHAGDGTSVEYKLYDTPVKVQDYAKISIKDGYYYINDENTLLLAPKTDYILTSKDINDNGILITQKDGFYQIGETYFNQTYQKIANRGGNNNGIGIEVCINQTADIYLNYQLTAKLVAKLLDSYQLDIKSIRPHHFFSGKNCPQTLRENHLWDHFLELVQTEYDILQFQKEGYQIQFIPLCDHIAPNGRIKDISKVIHYQIKTIKDGIVETYEYKS